MSKIPRNYDYLEFELNENISVNVAVKIINSGGVKIEIADTGVEDDAIGVLAETGTTGETKKVVTEGKIINTFTGQTPGAIAYIQTDGSITESSTSYPIGKFISTTKLLVSKDV